MKKQKKLFMLGAGLMQKPAIETAKNLGWHVTVVDGNPNALCAPLADIFKPIDLKDINALESFAKECKKTHGLDAVFTAGTDFSSSAAYIAEKLNLPGHSYQAALNATDKIRMRKAFETHSVPSPHFIEVKKQSLTQDIQHEFCTHFPLVVKPVDNMGARGCRLVRSQNELEQAVIDAIGYSKAERAIIEEYMDGPEFSIDSLICNGTLIITGLAVRHIYYPPYFIEMGHTMSAELVGQDQKDLLTTFEKAVHALGLTHGAAKGDIKLTSKGPMIGEVAARLSGGYMSGWTFPLASGINLTEQALLLSCGEIPDIFTEKTKKTFISKTVSYIEPQGFCAERAWLSIPGIVNHIYGHTEAQKTSNVCHVFSRVKEGDTVNFPVNNVEKCGNIIAASTSRVNAVFAAEEAARQILIRLKPHNPNTDAFLNTEADFPPSAYAVSAHDKEELKKTTGGIFIDFTKPLIKQLPPILDKYKIQPDWNRKPLSFAISQLENLLCNCKNKVDAYSFWHALIRGGVQGALYTADSGT